MPTVYLVPSGTDSADSATEGDYLLRPHEGGEFEAGRASTTGCQWFGTLSASLLPDLPQVDAPQEAPDQQAVLAAVQGVESAQTHRGG